MSAETHEFAFRSAINIRAYGTITVEAETLEAAKALITSDDFMMSKHFSPHGGGDDDYNWNSMRPETFLQSVVIDDDENTEEELEADLPDPIPPSGRMSFRDALRAASKHESPEMRVFRIDGPSFIVDELGQMRLENDCLYLGDMVDGYNWQVVPV